MKPKEDCFAYIDTSGSFEDEYTFKLTSCKILTEMVCKKKKCPFYKLKGTESEVRVHERNKRTE